MALAEARGLGTAEATPSSVAATPHTHSVTNGLTGPIDRFSSDKRRPIRNCPIRKGFTELPLDVVYHTLEFIGPFATYGIDKYLHEKSRATFGDAARVLQKWYRGKRLLFAAPMSKPSGSGDNGYGVTLRTLKRYYVAKYEPEWVRGLPTTAIRKLGLENHRMAGRYLNPTPEMQRAYVRTFYRFCEDLDVTSRLLYDYGW